jgi:hypothetical protein
LTAYVCQLLPDRHHGGRGSCTRRGHTIGLVESFASDFDPKLTPGIGQAPTCAKKDPLAKEAFASRLAFMRTIDGGYIPESMLVDVEALPLILTRR